MITKEKLKKKTLLTIYFREEEAERIVELLNKAHRRYKFEIEVGPQKTFEVYVRHNSETPLRVKDDILWFLLDRIAYDLAK